MKNNTSKLIENNKNIICICSLPMKKGILDDDYIFLKDGTIIHSFDKSTFDINCEEILKLNEISTNKRNKIFNYCPDTHKQEIAKILDISNDKKNDY